MRDVHFMGIGGVSMRGLARWYRADGLAVSGCDLHDGPALASLRAAGIPVMLGHDPAHVEGVDTLVTSMAVPGDHPEVLRARELGLRVVPRIELLAELFTRRSAVAVTGSHGKSTTTGMAATIFLAADVDPSVLLGASLPGLEHNMRYGSGRHVVAEVDESDPGFATLRSEIAIVTNLSDDHVAGSYSERRNYHASLDDLRHAAVQFASRAEHVLYCADWPGLGDLLGAHPSGASFGHAARSDYRIDDVQRDGDTTRFTLALPSGRSVPVELAVPLRHNLLNAAAALAAADLAGLDVAQVAPALATFRGVGRRWQRWGNVGGAEIVDDYAVHPTEVQAVLAAAKETGRRVRAVLQPHRWVRTALHWPALVEAAALADEVLVLDIYAAGEAAIPGISPDLIVAKLREQGREASRHTVASSIEYLRATLRDGDLVMTVGAGDVWRVAEALTLGRTGAPDDTVTPDGTVAPDGTVTPDGTVAEGARG
jgi:UDP-N-acetylmuramate--alanine ligase